MKKLLSILLALALVLGMASIATAEQQTVVKFWTHQNLAWNASYEVLIAEFEAANPDIDIEYTNFPYDDFEAKIQTSLIAGDAAADVYEVWGGWMLDFADAGALSETPEKFVAELREDAFPPVLGTLEKDGKIYGAPVELNVEYGAMVVNKGLFEQSGIAYPTTWQEVLDISKSVAEGSGDAMTMRGLEFGHRDGLCANFLSMIRQKGGKYITDDNQIDFNTPEAIAAMQELVDYIKVYNATNLDGTTNSQSMDSYAFVCLDECYMAVRGPWVLSDCVESFGRELGVDVDYIAQPPFYEGAEQRWVAETGWSLCVPNNTKVADAAWRFVEFILEPENLLRHNVACAQIPPRASVASDPSYLEQMPYMAPLMDILPLAEFIGPFNTGIMIEYTNSLEKRRSSITAGIDVYRKA